MTCPYSKVICLIDSLTLKCNDAAQLPEKIFDIDRDTPPLSSPSRLPLLVFIYSLLVSYLLFKLSFYFSNGPYFDRYSLKRLQFCSHFLPLDRGNSDFQANLRYYIFKKR